MNNQNNQNSQNSQNSLNSLNTPLNMQDNAAPATNTNAIPAASTNTTDTQQPPVPANQSPYNLEEDLNAYRMYQAAYEVTTTPKLTFGHGTEPLEAYMNQLPALDYHRAYGNYLEFYDSAKKQDLKISELRLYTLEEKCLQCLHEQTTDENVRFLQGIFFRQHWTELRESLKDNFAKALYVRNIAMHSSAFIKMLHDALAGTENSDLIFGVDTDFTGQYRQLSPSDILAGFEARHPISVHMRECAYYVNRLIRDPQIRGIFSINNGTLPECRHYGMTLAELCRQNVIFAVDQNYDTIKPQLNAAFQFSFGADFSSSNIEYLDQNPQDFLNHPDNQNTADLVYTLDGLSNCADREERAKFIQSFIRCAKVGGLIAFNVRVRDLDGLSNAGGGAVAFEKLVLERRATASLTPYMSVAAAQAEIIDICNELGTAIVTKAICDQRNIVPVGVYFELRRTQ